MNRTEGIVESLLFAADRPLSVEALKGIIEDVDLAQIRSAIENLRQRYDEHGHSFHIVPLAGGYQICTRPQYAKWVKGLYRSRAHTRLSKPALETLAIIAYKQPIVKAEIEVLRGVQIDSVLQTLLERNLITIKGRKPTPGRPLLYGTSNEFLRYFGLNKITDLPARGELQSLVEGPKPVEGLVTDHEGEVKQIFSPERGDVQTAGGSVHSGGADSS
jgi:segregation and condensation protein B